MVDNITIVSASGRGSVIMANRDYAGYWLGTVDWGEVTGQNKLYSFTTSWARLLCPPPSAAGSCRWRAGSSSTAA